MPFSRWTRKVRRSHECHKPYSGKFQVGSQWTCRCGQKWCVVRIGLGEVYVWARS